jgi:hypothetical protein
VTVGGVPGILNGTKQLEVIGAKLGGRDRIQRS